MGAFDWLFGKETPPSVQTVSTLTPQQKLIQRALAGRISALGPTATPYGGEGVAGITADETASLEKLKALSGGGTLGPEIESAYSKALTGTPTSTIDPATTEQYYQDTLYGPTMKAWKEDVAPYMAEQYTGSGGYWGGARANAISRGTSDVFNELSSERANLMYQDETARRALNESAADRALKAAEGASVYGNYKFQNQKDLLAAQALPRLLDQLQLDWDFKEFLRTAPENAPYLKYAMDFLGIKATETVGFEGNYQQGAFVDMLKAVAAVAT